MIFALGGMLACYFAALCWRFPRQAFFLALLWLVCVPYWLSLDANGVVPFAALPVMILGAVRVATAPFVLRWPDVLALTLMGGVTAVGLLGLSDRGSGLVAAAVWLPSYVSARSISCQFGVESVVRPLALIGVGLGMASVVELALNWHPYVGVRTGPGWEVWTPLQLRGGVVRSEWAEGHSIALGTILAGSAAAVLTRPWPSWVRAACFAIVAAGVACTFSRGALAGLVIASGAWVLTDRRLRLGPRVAGAGFLVLSGVVAWTILSTVFREASGEAAQSSNYRKLLLVTQVRNMEFVGRADLSSLRVAVGGFASVDNSVLWFGLAFGIVFAFIFILVVTARLSEIFRGVHVAPNALVLLGIVPNLLTVAPINQLQVFIFVVLGSAAAERRLGTSRGRPVIGRSASVQKGGESGGAD